MKKRWIKLYVFIMAIGTIALFGLFREKNETKDFTPTPQIEKVFNTTSTDKFAIVFYKKHCPYCEIAKSSVVKLAQKSKYPVFYIDTQSEMGKKLIPITKIKYASTIVVFTLKERGNLPIGQVIFSEKSDEQNTFTIERWGYADNLGGKKVSLVKNIKKAFEIEKNKEKK